MFMRRLSLITLFVSSVYTPFVLATPVSAQDPVPSNNQGIDIPDVPPDIAVFYEEDVKNSETIPQDSETDTQDSKIKPITELPTPSQPTGSDSANNGATQPLPPTEGTEPIAQPLPVIDWSADSINNAVWSPDIEKGQLPMFLKAQILLSRSHSSPGAIDGATGRNTLKAISAFEFMNGLPVDGKLDIDVWNKLLEVDTTPVMTSYTITDADVNAYYPKSIPSDYALQAKMSSLAYTSVAEMLGEKFHVDVSFLQKLNPNTSFNKAGETILVPDLGEPDTRPIKLIVAIKKAGQLYGFDENNKMIATFPATVGSRETPSPTGKYRVVAVSPNPHYAYNPKNFIQGNNLKPLLLPPGPNNPVGLMWIGLSKPSFGIHGNPNPSGISKGSGSHGCVRLTNWDVQSLAKRIQPGIKVHLQ